MAIQLEYNAYLQAGYAGDIARPSEPHAFDYGPAQVPTSGRNPRPGDMVYWDSTNNGFAFPTTAALVHAAVGVVSFDPGTVAKAGTPGTNQNSGDFIEYEDGAPMKVCVFGTVWVIAGGALEYGDLVQQDTHSTPDYMWDAFTPAVANVANLAAAMGGRTFECVSTKAVAANGLAQVRIGYGRIV